MNVVEKAKLAKKASGLLAALAPQQRAKALLCMAQELELGQSHIFRANNEDLDAAGKSGITGAMRKRLALSEAKINGMVRALRQIAQLPDNLGEIIEKINRPNGLAIKKVRVPFGVIGIIYESRPNVTADAAGLCIKSGNAIILRGGTEALRSNTAIVSKLRTGLERAGISPECIQFLDNPDRSEVHTMMNLRDQIDLLIPRGGPGLIQATIQNATIPVIETGVGNCHTYVDATAGLAMAHSITVNAKVSNPAVCNTMETLLVHEKIAPEFLPGVARALISHGVELRGCPRSRKLVESIRPAAEEDWSTEYLGLFLAIKVVSGFEEAIEHISKYGTAHSEAIITEDPEAACKFTQSVDAATVYVNASTRFTDGGEFGFGAEMGISTQKLHARGPMGINELTTYKYVVEGTGQTR
ncbi:MAG TPA: glutamate-5-semialdehyde dehydrogenase [Firmicutes bacterium]|nr:glutamate-5-semialdehyde dehydrogenase [Candidatus Fermentithermobacillaceae bacterium]